jgi:hypothetical protein
MEIGGVVWLAYLLLSRHVRRASLVVAGTVLVGVATPLLSVYEWIWSETGFILICLAFIVVLERLVEHPTSKRLLLTAAVLTWSAYLFRYVGASLIPVGAFALLCGFHARGWRASVVNAARFTAIAVLIPMAWSIRNFEVSGTIAGARTPPTYGIGFVFTRFVDTVGAWIWPRETNLSLTFGEGELISHPLVGAIVLVATVLVVAILVGHRMLRGIDSPFGVSLGPLILFLVFYAVFYVYGDRRASTLLGIDNRLASPLFVPLVILAIVSIDRLLDIAPQRIGNAVRIATVVLVAGGIAVQSTSTERLVKQSVTQGVGFSGPAWLRSPMANAARTLPANALILSNAISYLWPVLNRTLYESPMKSAPELPKSVVRKFACEHGYLLWSFRFPVPGSYQLSDFKSAMDLTWLGSYVDGQIFRMGPLLGTDLCKPSQST